MECANIPSTIEREVQSPPTLRKAAECISVWKPRPTRSHLNRENLPDLGGQDNVDLAIRPLTLTKVGFVVDGPGNTNTVICESTWRRCCKACGDSPMRCWG